jgi:hypothetical protein
MGIKIPNMVHRKTVEPFAEAETAGPGRIGTSLPDAPLRDTTTRPVLLFGQPDRSFFATELIHLARAGRGAVQRAQTACESGLAPYLFGKLAPTKRIGYRQCSSICATLSGKPWDCTMIREALTLSTAGIFRVALYGPWQKHRYGDERYRPARRFRCTDFKELTPL